MNLTDVETAERLATMHLLSGEYGLTECGLNASTVHATAFTQNIDCRACARLFVESDCFDDDPLACTSERHRRAAALAYPKLEVVR